MMPPLKKRILDISYKHKLQHIGSCLTSVDIIDDIFKKKKPDEKFVLSNGQSAIALYTVLEKYRGRNAEEIFKDHGSNPVRCKKCGIDCSSGSLGHGLPIAIGMALADRKKNVYCLISDGECAEGSIWESIHLMDKCKLTNLHIWVNWNGWSAYQKSPLIYQKLLHLNKHIQIRKTNVEQIPFLKGQDAHHHTMTKEEYDAIS